MGQLLSGFGVVSRANPDHRPARVAVRSSGVTRVVDVSRVERLEAEGPYVRVHEANRSFLLPGSLNSMIPRLGSGRFARVHRSFAVALAAIVEIRRDRAGKLTAVLAGGASVPVTRISREELERQIESSE